MEGAVKTESHASTAHRPAGTKAIALRQEGRIETLLTAGTRLKAHVWTPGEIGEIQTEDLAITAYQLSDILRKEFASCAAFLVLWRGLRKQNRLSSQPPIQPL